MAVEPLTRLGHLTRRFCATLNGRVRPGELDRVGSVLSPNQWLLFRRLREGDQRHSLDLYERLLADGHEQPDLLQAALLHDVGKAFGPLPIGYRVIYGLSALLDRRLAAWLAQTDRPGWRRPFYLAARHPEVGADAAEAAGSNPIVVRLIREHQFPGDDELSQLLHRYDEAM